MRRIYSEQPQINIIDFIFIATNLKRSTAKGEKGEKGVEKVGVRRGVLMILLLHLYTRKYVLEPLSKLIRFNNPKNSPYIEIHFRWVFLNLHTPLRNPRYRLE